MEKISREKFVRLAGTLGVGVAAASVTACGGSSGGSGSGSSNGSGGENKPETSKSSEKKPEKVGSGASIIAVESDVAPGSAKKFKDGGEDSVLVRLDSGDFVAYSAICTHQGCVVAYKEDQFSCPCHGSVFDPANGGEVVTGPAKTPLPGIPVKIQDGNVVKA